MSGQPPPLDLRGIQRAAIVAAHPDDETLGASGLVQRLHTEGVALSLIIATDGEAAFPRSTAGERRELATARGAELANALDELGIAEVRPIRLGLPDSAVGEHAAWLRRELADLLRDCDMCLFPWPDDPHPDHREVGTAAVSAAPVGTQCWSYPIWGWYWPTSATAEVPWPRAAAHQLTEAQRAAKSSAVRAFTSQLDRGPRGEDPILPRELLSRFDQPREIFIREPARRSAPVERFGELYRASADPWGTADRWYERRKRSALLAALPRVHYGTIVEPACGNGTLTRELAARCDRVIAFDPVAEAVEIARRTTAGMPRVELRRAALPGGLNTTADLLVHGEILYYLDDEDLEATLERTSSRLRSGGQVVAVHGKSWPPEAPHDGEEVHRRLLDHPDLEVLVAHDDEDFLLHVLQRR